MEFVLDNKLGEPDLSTGELLARIPFKRPKSTVDTFIPDSDNKDPLNTKRWIQAEDFFQMAGTCLLDLEGNIGQPPEDMPCSLL